MDYNLYFWFVYFRVGRSNIQMIYMERFKLKTPSPCLDLALSVYKKITCLKVIGKADGKLLPKVFYQHTYGNLSPLSH